MTPKTSFGTQLAPQDHSLEEGGALKGSRGSKLKLQDIWHVGCLFITILVKEVLIVIKDILWDPAGWGGGMRKKVATCIVLVYQLQDHSLLSQKSAKPTKVNCLR